MKTMVRGCLSLMALACVFALGCGSTATTPPKDKQVASKDKDGKKPHDHSGWWCDDHGIPEHECSMCSPTFAEKCKATGDWCKEHDRAKSQCFVCNPDRRKLYAAKYKEKFDGHEPPPIPEFDDKK